MSDDDITSLTPQREWLDPWNYPSRVTETLAMSIAMEIASGADIKAAGMLHGVAPSRLMRWLRWGQEAYMRDADGNDPHADCLNLFLKVMQATGMATAPVQQAVRVDNSAWWLSHNPDTRASWGQQVVLAEPMIEAVPEAIEAPVQLVPEPDAAEQQRMLADMVRYGAIKLPSELLPPEQDEQKATG